MIDTPTKATRRIDKTPLNPDGRALRRMERDARERIHAALLKWGRSLFRDVKPDTIALVTARLDDHEYSKPLRDTLIAVLQDVAAAGAEHGQRQVESVFLGVKAVDPLDVTPGLMSSVALGVVDWTAANTDAAQWAIEYGYSLIRGITDTTRAQVAREIRYFVDNSLTVNQLRDRLMAGHLFSRNRAEAIAVTEVTRAYAEGNVAAWKASKVVEGKEWMTAFDEVTCPICRPLSGKIAKLNEPFDGRIMNPPAHPRCRCWVVPVVIGDTEVLSDVGVGPWGAAGAVTQIPQAARTIAPVFQTVKEAEKWAVENKLADSVDYSKLPVGIANEINSALADFYTEYGVTLGKIGYRQNMDLYDNIMEVKRYKEGVIRGGELVGYRDMADLRINPVFFNNPNAKAILSRSYESGWAYSENIHDLITHEFGHIRTNTDDSRFLAGPGNIKTLSRYGQSSNSEAIAELFLKRRKFGDANLTPEEAQFLAQYTR